METAFKVGQYVILKNGNNAIGNGSICKVTKVVEAGRSYWLKAPWMGKHSHQFRAELLLPMPKMSIKPIMRLTVEQNKWLSNYYDLTGFEPMHLADLEMGAISFENAAEHNLQWYEDHTSETFLSITQKYHNLPVKE